MSTTLVSISNKNSFILFNYLEKFHIDQEILNKYDENNPKFSIQSILMNEETNSIIHCIYRYENNQIQLEYHISNQLWTIKSNLEEQKNLLKEINNTTNLSFDQQIELIIEIFDQYFHQENQFPKSSTIIEEQTDSNRLTISTRIRHESSCSSVNSIKHTE